MERREVQSMKHLVRNDCQDGIRVEFVLDRLDQNGVQGLGLALKLGNILFRNEANQFAYSSLQLRASDRNRYRGELIRGYQPDQQPVVKYKVLDDLYSRWNELLNPVPVKSRATNQLDTRIQPAEKLEEKLGPVALKVLPGDV